MPDLNVELPENREPWLIDWNVRFAEFSTACRQDDAKRVVMVYDAPNTSSFRYRVYNVKQAMAGDDRFHISYFYRDELPRLKEYLHRIDLAILCRCQWTLEIQETCSILKSLRVPIAFDMDDLFCDLERLQLITNTLNVALDSEAAYSWWFAAISRTYMVGRMADCFIATNAYLGEMLSRQFGGRPFHVINNSLNREQLQISAAVCEKKKSAAPNRNFTIGYFSGTPSHINDFKVAAPEIAGLLREFPEMRLRVVGFMDFPDYMNELLQQNRIEFRPLVDFMELQRLVGEVDLNIAPLVDNVFTNCKSELKFFEAAVVDTPTCATPTYTFAGAIKHGETGFLCRPGQWRPVIADIYQGKYDIARINAAAKKYCLERYSGARFREQIAETFSAILEDARSVKKLGLTNEANA